MQMKLSSLVCCISYRRFKWCELIFCRIFLSERYSTVWKKKIFTNMYMDASITFLFNVLCGVQLSAAEVTMRKHSCFTTVWCHHKTARPVLIFNKDRTFISHLQTVREKHKVQINWADCFPVGFKLSFLFFQIRSLANKWWRNFCPYQWAVSGCYCKGKMYRTESCNLTHQAGVSPERH